VADPRGGLGGLQPPCAGSLQVGGSKGEEERRERGRERKEEEGKGRRRNTKVKKKTERI
jgi:hypothetical protein